MNIIFWITFLICILFGLYSFNIKKDYFNIFIFVVIGVYLPLLLYMAKWSDLIYIEVSNKFYLIFIYLNISLIISFLLIKHNKNDKSFKFCLRNRRKFDLVNIIYVLLYLLENYIGSKTIFPTMNNIDIHTFSAPIISFITKNLYIILVFNLMFYLYTKKKKYILYIITLVLIPIITRGARMQVLIAISQVIVFLLYYLYSNREKYNFRIKKHNIILMGVLGIFLINFMVNYTDYRMNHFGKYDLKYENTIKYTGPKFMGKVLPVYYGYFPISFNNLNINISLNNIKHNYIGIYSFKSLNYGVLQLDNLLGIEPYKPENTAIVTSKSATVPTGFYDYYYDFGVFCFIPIIFSIIIYIFLYKKSKSSGSVYWKVVYCYYMPLWIFISFQNTLYNTAIPAGIVLLFIFCKIFIKNV